jgi:hypothetical protein
MAISDSKKQAIRKEYKYKCQYCNNDNAKHIEHIIARDNGGSDDLDNLTLACEGCNTKKSNLKLPETYAGILLARAKQKRKKIEQRLSSNKRKISKSGNDPSEFFIEELLKNHTKDKKYLKINTSEEHIKNLAILYKQQSKIVHDSDGKGYIEYQTYKWNSLFGEHFHNVFKNMMYINIDTVEYIEGTKKFRKIGSENLLTGIFYGVNEYVKLYLSDRLIKYISDDTIFGFRDLLCGKELEYKEIKTNKQHIENPFL